MIARHCHRETLPPAGVAVCGMTDSVPPSLCQRASARHALGERPQLRLNAAENAAALR